MEALVIVALVCVSYEEGMRSYGFATHVWETGARDFARVNIASRWREGCVFRGGHGGKGRTYMEEPGCWTHVGEMV